MPYGEAGGGLLMPFKKWDLIVSLHFRKKVPCIIRETREGGGNLSHQARNEDRFGKKEGKRRRLDQRKWEK